MGFFVFSAVCMAVCMAVCFRSGRGKERATLSRKRVVVKVGSSSLTDESGRLSRLKMEGIADQITQTVRTTEAQVVLVSSGAGAAGMERLGWRRATSTMPERQAAAAVGQGLLIDRYEQIFRERGLTIAQILLTRSDVSERKSFVHIRNTLETLLRHGILPIVNENDTVAVEQLRFGDNDTLSSLVALVAEAQILVLLTDIDGLYSGNPRTDPQAKRIPDVWQITEDIERMAGGQGTQVGTGGMRTKLQAAKIATESGIDVVIAASTQDGALARAVQGDSVGTRFHARADGRRAKRSWMAHGPQTGGTLVIDAGAAKALAEQSRSLLLPGIVRVEGEFSEGAIVELATGDSGVIGRGMTNFSATDLRLLLERRLGGDRAPQVQEVVHRNEMVILRGGESVLRQSHRGSEK